MSVRAPVSIEEYLATSYDGLDREYVYGEVVERTLPKKEHSWIQLLLGSIFHHHRKHAPLLPYGELRVKIDSNRVRITDISVYSEPFDGPYPTEPALVVVEIISPDDRFSDLLQKLHEYQDWGVPHIWVVDPNLKTLSVFRNGLMEVPAFEIPEYSISIPAGEIFA